MVLHTPPQGSSLGVFQTNRLLNQPEGSGVVLEAGSGSEDWGSWSASELSVIDIWSFSFSNNFFSNKTSVSHTHSEQRPSEERGEDAAANSISPRQTQKV